MGKKKNKLPEVDASSMADIAFLLLLFFLVTTTIDIDKGIMHRLPPFTDEPPPPVKLNDRNILEVLVNSQDRLLVENKDVKVRDLKQVCIDHITNNGVNPDYADSPEDAIISLKNDRGTSYGIYLAIQDQVKAAYREIRDAEAMKETNGRFTYNQLKECEKDPDNKEDKRIYCEQIADKIKAKYPMKISEAEPEDLAAQ